MRRFAAAHASAGGAVQKSFGPNTITESGQTKVAFTRRLDDAALADLRGVDATATQVVVACRTTQISPLGSSWDGRALG